MNDDSLAALKPVQARQPGITAAAEERSQVTEKTLIPQAPANPVADDQPNENGAGRSNGDPHPEKSDSEAETVVLSGKEEGQENKSKKAIKLEEASRQEPAVDQGLTSVPVVQEHDAEGRHGDESRKPSLKRKRVTLEQGNSEDLHGGNSSNLSSTTSSPVQEPRSSKATDTASNRSLSSPPLDELAPGQEGRPGKSRTGINLAQGRCGGHKSDGGSEPVIARNRRDTRSATHYDDPARRSDSPPLRTNKRAQSIHSNAPVAGVTKRKRAPAPLLVERRRTSEENLPESDDDSSIHSHTHLQKLSSVQTNTFSPAKMVSQKKNRDRNGRTLLARACQVGEPEEVRKWLIERPQDINVPDNAGNTPFQIAALDGYAGVVQLLLDAGCDIDCKNIDKDTPLIDAVENGKLEVVRLLLKAGLDPRQTNAFGKEPLDLVNEDKDDATQIREALQTSKKEKALLRRPSDDYHRQHSVGSRDAEVPAGGIPSGASPATSTRSPPPTGLGARRRTARSQPTDDALLWVNATPARLRDAAGKGDMTIVDHILKMRPQADTESILAAARGGHDDVLNLMLAIATPDPDPEPLRSEEYNFAYSTPMLAAIGRGNTSIIKLLLAQPGFDPTRRIVRGMTYYELAKERQGSEWQEEHDILKEEYDDYKKNGGRKSKNSSPRKVRTKRSDSTKSVSEPSSSPHESRKSRKNIVRKDEPSDGIKHSSSNRGTVQKGANQKQYSPALTSDPEQGLLDPLKAKVKEGRIVEEKGSSSGKRLDGLKPKRRLMSGNEFKTDQDLKRRASLAADADVSRLKSGHSVGSHGGRQRRFSDASESIGKVTAEEQSETRSEAGKKRYRSSVSPQGTKTELIAGNDIKKKKRRVDSQGSAVDQGRDRSIQLAAPATVANMLPSLAAMVPAPVPQGTAPVAFMGSNVASPVTKSPTESQSPFAIISPVNSMDQALSHRAYQEGYLQNSASPDKAAGAPLRQGLEHQPPEFPPEIVPVEAQQHLQIEAQQESQFQAEKEADERESRQSREEEESRLEEQRQKAEAEQQIRSEQEQKESHLAKLKRDEEMHQQRLDQERLQKEEQDRKWREMEERENLRQLRIQEEKERQRLQSLPNGLRRAAELSSEEAKNAKEITKWLPLRTVTTQELNPGNGVPVSEERWIANIQAAPLLAIKDLDLSQCKHPIVVFYCVQTSPNVYQTPLGTVSLLL